MFAHPDDPEVACGGTLARWAALGCEVHLVIACRGEKGSFDPSTDPDALAASRAEEVARAAEVLQLASVEHLGYPDGEIENDAALRARLIEIVRRRRPDALVAPDPTAVFFGDSYVNHRDHRQLGWARARHARARPPARSTCPRPGPRTRWRSCCSPGTLDADAWVDIDAVLDTKVAAVACHESRLGGDPELVAELLEHRAAEEGRRAGIEHAEAFRRLRFTG